jgi:hypothetical protein
MQQVSACIAIISTAAAGRQLHTPGENGQKLLISAPRLMLVRLRYRTIRQLVKLQSAG